MKEALEAMLRWGAEREVTTKLGPRMVRNAAPTEEFWAAWKANAGALKALGISVGEWQGKWRVAWWRKLDAEVVAQRQAREQASKAPAAEIDVPAPTGCTYMPFQLAGIRFASMTGNCLIADEMGLGKTIQAIGFVNLDPHCHRVLVVTKASLKWNWHRELTKWLTRGQTVGIADSKCWPSTDVVIANYDILHKYPKKLEFMWDLVIADEVQQCKNPRARRTKALFGYTPTKKEREDGMLPTSGVVAKRKLALTGTPIENRPAEIQPMLQWLQPNEPAWNRWSFAKRYCGGHQNGHGWDYSGASNLDELRKKLRERVMVRRLKKDVLTELPPKTRMVELVECEEAAAAVKAEADFLAQNSDAIEAAQVRMELAKAGSEEEFRQAVESLGDTFRVAFTEIARLRHVTALAKVPAVIEYLKEVMEECPKVLVFAHHNDVLQQLHAAFPGSCLVTGDTPPEKRQAIVDRFQRQPECSPFFGSIYATGEGLTLTAASLVVFAEPVWVPGKMVQCEDRAHRIGQQDNVLVKYLVVPNSLDARVMNTLIEKMAVIEQALDRGKVVSYDDEPLVLPSSYKGGTRGQYHNEGEMITDAQADAVKACLQTLAGMCDGAHQLDGCGFNKIDSAIGKSLATQSRFLSPAQLALGRRICRKYVRQLGANAVEAMG